MRPFLYLYAVSDSLLLHRRFHLHRRDIPVSRNSFVCCDRWHLRILSDDKRYPVGCDKVNCGNAAREGALGYDLGAPHLTIGTRPPVGEQHCAPTQRQIKRFLDVPCADSGRAADAHYALLQLRMYKWFTNGAPSRRTLRFTFMMKYNDMKKSKTLRSPHANFPFSILNFPFLSSSSSSAFQRYRPAAPLKAARPAGCHAILPDSRGSSRRSRAAR